MPEIVIELPEDVNRKLLEISHIDWSMLIAEYIKREAIKLARLKSITNKSKLTEKDAIELGRMINKSLHERYKKIYPQMH